MATFKDPRQLAANIVTNDQIDELLKRYPYNDGKLRKVGNSLVYKNFDNGAGDHIVIDYNNGKFTTRDYSGGGADYDFDNIEDIVNDFPFFHKR